MGMVKRYTPGKLPGCIMWEWQPQSLPGRDILFPAGKSSKEGSARARYFQNNVAQPVALTDIAFHPLEGALFLTPEKVPKKGAQGRGRAQTVWLQESC